MSVSAINRQMLNALKSGSYANTETALDKGANAKLGITFMFKIHKLYDASVAIPLIKLLKERQPAEPARPASRASAAGEAAGGTAYQMDGKSAATIAVKLARQLASSAGSSLAGTMTRPSAHYGSAGRPDSVGPDPALGPEADNSDDDDDEPVSDEQFFSELKRRASLKSLKSNWSSNRSSTNSDFSSPTGSPVGTQPRASAPLPRSKSGLVDGSDKPWYGGTAGKRKCANILKSGTTGDFVVRKTREDAYSMLLNDHGKVAVYGIRLHKPHLGGDPKLDILGRRHTDLDALVSNCRTRHLVGTHSGQLIPLHDGVSMHGKRR